MFHELHYRGGSGKFGVVNAQDPKGRVVGSMGKTGLSKRSTTLESCNIREIVVGACSDGASNGETNGGKATL